MKVTRRGGMSMSSKNLYVGNLPFTTTEQDLSQLFGQYGTVTKAQVIRIGRPGAAAGSGSSRCPAGPMRPSRR